MKKKSLIISSIAAALVVTASIGSAFAYFSTYEEAKGGYTIHLGDYEEATEDFQEWTKKLVVTSDPKSNEEVYVRAIAYAGSQYNLTYSEPNGGSSWTLGSDGFFYYNQPMKPGESTAELDIHIGNIPEAINMQDPTQFNVVVVYECTRAQYKADGTPYADWSKKLEPIEHEIANSADIDTSTTYYDSNGNPIPNPNGGDN